MGIYEIISKEEMIQKINEIEKDIARWQRVVYKEDELNEHRDLQIIKLIATLKATKETAKILIDDFIKQINNRDLIDRRIREDWIRVLQKQRSEIE